MKHISVDLETLGTRPGCQILSIGAVEFSSAGLGREFYCVLNTADQEALGLHTEEGTMQWWRRQSEEARKVFTDPKQLPFEAGLLAFKQWCSELGGRKSIFPWGNGADFDNAILHVAYAKVEMDPPWMFYNSRCYRTLKNLPGAPALAKREGTYHNALDDAKTQALHAIEVLKALKLEL